MTTIIAAAGIAVLVLVAGNLGFGALVAFLVVAARLIPLLQR